MINPFTGDKLSTEAAAKVDGLREARSNARKAARSGHPGRRADAKKALEMIPEEIKGVYMDEAVGSL